MIAALVCLASLQGVLPDRDSTAVATIRANVPDMQRQHGVPGVVITVVREGRIVLNQGFGFANVEDSIPIDAERTVLRTASVSKTFTALAILRLARFGKLDLQADVRRLVPELRAREPISIHHLLTHTSGIEDRDLGYMNGAGTPPQELAEVVAAIPVPKRPPADVPGYSNFGHAVAGLAAERVSGVPFSDYLRDSVLAPLGMPNTGFVLTPGPATPPGLAMEYRSDGTRRIQRSSRPYPAGNIGTTGADMARLLSQLDHPDVSALLTPRLRYHPDMPPMGYGLAASTIAGTTVWMKGGDSPSHSAVIAVVPEQKLGVFIALNRQEPLFWKPLLERIIAVYGDTSAASAAGIVTSGAARVSGDYLWTRAPLSSAARILGLAVQIRVRATGDRLTISGFELFAGSWVRRGDLVYHDSTGRRLAFRADAAGRVSHGFSIDGGQPISFERIPWYRSTRAQLSTLAVAVVAILIFGIATLVRWRHTRPRERALRLLAVLILAATFVAVVLTADQADQLVVGPTLALYACLAFTTLAAIVSVVNATLGIRSLVSSATLAARAANGIWTLTCLGPFWFLFTNNLIGFRL